MLGLDEMTGQALWTATEGNEGGVMSPVVANGVVFAAFRDEPFTSDVSAFALDATTGDSQWSFETPQGSEGASPVVADGLLFLGWNNGTLFAFAPT